ncbi:MAG: SCO family protein [Candidatus Marinimicrobia bacterium]|nr:SCO family protein [Candidatus Neomarinimicrobiota bacterium]
MKNLIREKRFWLFLGFSVIVIMTFFKKLERTGDENIPVYHQLPEFILTDQHANEFSREDLLGKVWVADFIFTTCAGPCPIMTSQFTELQDRFSENPDFRLLSISVNPEYDTPAVLKEYGDRYSADYSRWSFLTGTREDIHDLAVNGFHVGSVDEPVFHSTRFILVDRQSRIRGYYISSEQEDMKKLWNDVSVLIHSS